MFEIAGRLPVGAHAVDRLLGDTVHAAELAVALQDLHVRIPVLGHEQVRLHLPQLHEGVGDSDAMAADERTVDVPLAPVVGVTELGAVEVVEAVFIVEVHVGFEAEVDLTGEAELLGEGGLAATGQTADDVELGDH